MCMHVHVHVCNLSAHSPYTCVHMSGHECLQCLYVCRYTCCSGVWQKKRMACSPSAVTYLPTDWMRNPGYLGLSLCKRLSRKYNNNNNIAHTHTSTSVIYTLTVYTAAHTHKYKNYIELNTFHRHNHIFCDPKRFGPNILRHRTVPPICRMHHHTCTYAHIHTSECNEVQ